MKYAISQTCTLQAPIEEELPAYAQGGWSAVELWLTKVEKFLENHSLDDLRELLSKNQLAPVAASYQGGLLTPQGEARQAAFDLFKRRLELCQALGVPVMIIAPDFHTRPDQTTVQRALVSLKQAAQWAAAFEVKLALEFRGTDGFLSSLDTTIQAVEMVEESNLGICIDLFHYYKGPSKFEDLKRLNPSQLYIVQVADVMGTPRELMSDSDRVMPGDGEFRLLEVLQAIQQMGFQGPISLELFNPLFWQMKLSQISELGFTALKRVCEK